MQESLRSRDATFESLERTASIIIENPREVGAAVWHSVTDTVRNFAKGDTQATANVFSVVAEAGAGARLGASATARGAEAVQDGGRRIAQVMRQVGDGVPNRAFSAGDLVRQINIGGDTGDIASALARQFTRSAPGPNSGSVILGRWGMTLDGPGTSSMGYIDIAKRNGGTWFETPETFWPQLREGFVNSGADPKLAMRMADDAAFKVNEQFLFQQARDGMQFKLVNTTPRHAEQYFLNSATLREIDLLNSDQFKALGYLRNGNTWVRGQ